MIMDDATPPTQPSGSLVPPPSGPSTALALATPEPPSRAAERTPYMREYAFRKWISQTLDRIDQVADTVAEGLGLR